MSTGIEKLTIDSTPWKRILTTSLGKQIRKHCDCLIADLLAVDSGIKPAYLYDVGSTCSSKLCDTLCNLKAERVLQNRLAVVEIHGDYLIVNCEMFRQTVADCEKLLEKLIDISVSLDHPRLYTGSTAVRHLKTACYSLLDQMACSDFIKFEPSPECNVSSLFGILLGYPVIYWYNTEPHGCHDNCLAMEMLVNVRLHVSLELQHQKPYMRRHCLYSFSFPHTLLTELETHVNLWTEHVQEKVKKSQYFNNAVVERDNVVLEAVSI